MIKSSCWSLNLLLHKHTDTHIDTRTHTQAHQPIPHGGCLRGKRPSGAAALGVSSEACPQYTSPVCIVSPVVCSLLCTGGAMSLQRAFPLTWGISFGQIKVFLRHWENKIRNSKPYVGHCLGEDAQLAEIPALR